MRTDALGLPITLDLEGARALIIGPDDDERRRKQLLLEDAGAIIEALTPDHFSDEKIGNARVVMVSAHDTALTARVAAAARARGALVWCSDAPEHSDFAMPAIARLGRARIAVATGGGAPALAKRMREQLEAALDNPRFRRFVDELAALREQLEGADFETKRAELTKAIEGFVLELGVRYPDWLK
jgi:siroheme synthase (precorrin-2 oxidase/ferrochelatase)